MINIGHPDYQCPTCHRVMAYDKLCTDITMFHFVHCANPVCINSTTTAFVYDKNTGNIAYYLVWKDSEWQIVKV